jgi:hypothetical protein
MSIVNNPNKNLEEINMENHTKKDFHIEITKEIVDDNTTIQDVLEVIRYNLVAEHSKGYLTDIQIKLIKQLCNEMLYIVNHTTSEIYHEYNEE